MDEPIRVLHVIGIMNRGGAETMIMNLYRNIDRTKVQFDFVENSFEPAAFDEEIRALGGRIYRCPHYNGKNHFAYVKWWNAFFQEHLGEYPIVHGHLGSTAAIYLSIAKKYGIYSIAHSHNTNSETCLQQCMYNIFSYPTRFIADYFFACSSDAARDRFGKRIAKNKRICQVLKNAIDVSEYRFNHDLRVSLRRELDISEAVVIGHVGRFAAQKNHKFLVDVFQHIHEKDHRAILLLVGDGELRSEIERETKKRGLAEYVIFTGIQSNVQQFYQAMDVFVFPSIYEGLGVVAIEAQAAGLPCCVADTLPREAYITKLIQFRSLKDGAEKWAEWVLSRVNEPRVNVLEDIKEAGYYISSTSVWLENFYRNVARSHEQ